MIEVVLIGIGTGNPDHLTGQAIKAMNAADLLLIPQKGPGKSDLADLRREICDRFLCNPATKIVGFDLPERRAANPDYQGRVRDWHEAIAEVWRQAIATHLGDSGTVGLLVWGDPALYDSSLRIAERLAVKVSVIPGLTSLQLLTAAHAIPLNTLAEPFLVTTGRKLREAGFPAGIETVVVMLDAECSFQSLPVAGLTVYWGAFLGMAEQITLSGPLATVGPQIVRRREQARAAHGWIMDIYLLRRV